MNDELLRNWNETSCTNPSNHSAFALKKWGVWLYVSSWPKFDTRGYCRSFHLLRGSVKIKLVVFMKHYQSLRSGLLGCDIVSLGKRFPTFRKNVVLPSSKDKQAQTIWSLKTNITLMCHIWGRTRWRTESWMAERERVEIGEDYWMMRTVVSPSLID
jgi:hypothetical protein